MGAGWTFHYRNGGSAVGSPNWDLVDVDSANGRYEISLVVEEGGSQNCYLVPPAGFTKNVDSYSFAVDAFDLASIVALINAASGDPTDGDRLTVYDHTVREGDTFQRVMTVPITALSDYDESDLTNVVAISAAARTVENRLATAPDFTIGAAVTDAANRQVAIGWSTMPAGASISGFTITTLSQVGKTFTVSGDQSNFFRDVTTVRVTNSAANDGEYTLTLVTVSGGNTILTVAEDIPDATAGGTIAQAAESRQFEYDLQIKIERDYSITAVNTGSKQFTIAGDRRRYFNVGGGFSVTGSTGNDGDYTVASLALSGGNTLIVVNETVASAVADGAVTLTFTITPIDGTITVERQEVRT